MEEKTKNKKQPNEYLYNVLGIAIIFAIWALFSFLKVQEGYNQNLFPDPLTVLKRFFYNFGEAKVWIAIGWTFLRLAIGFCISFVFGAVFGTLAGLFKRVKYTMNPIITVFKSVPTAAITFIILLMLGHDWTPCALVFLVAFPIIYQSFVTGIENVDKTIQEAASMEATKYNPQVVFRVMLPATVPYVSLAILTSLGVSMKVSVMSEIVAGGSSANGIGRLIYVAYNIEGDNPQVYALSLVTILIILILDIAIKQLKKYQLK